MTILPPAPWQDREGLAALVAAFPAGTLRHVGGAVRDALLGLDAADLDCATTLPPDESRERIAAAGFKAVPTGIAHGTVTAVLPSGPVEVTTLRRDVATDGRRAVVAFTDDWQADAARRDFTINALSAEPAGGAVHDYFGGLDDLAAGRVRFIGDAAARIAEDHLRILRFYRFHARFGRGAPDAEGAAACAAAAATLKALSRERIAMELLKLLALPDPAPTVAGMIADGVLAPVLPEIDANGLHRLERLVAREPALGLGPDPLRRLSALLPADPAAAEDIAVRLKLAKLHRKRLAAAAAPAPAPPAQLAYRIGRDAATDWLAIHDGPADALADWQRPAFPLTGGALIARGLAPGPRVAETLQAIERRWVAEGFPDAPRLAALVDEAIG